jgi:hypothetical protein
VKKLLILVLILLPVIWWSRDPQAARLQTAQCLRLIAVKSVGFADKLDPPPPVDPDEALAASLPEGVYLLRQDVTAKFQPVPGIIVKGSQVRVLGEGNGKKIITDGIREAVIDADLLTREPAEVGELTKVAQAERDAQLSRQRAELKASLAQVQSKIESFKLELDAVRLRDSQSRESGKKNPQYGTQAEFLLTEIRRQEGFRDELLKQIEELR